MLEQSNRFEIIETTSKQMLAGVSHPVFIVKDTKFRRTVGRFIQRNDEWQFDVDAAFVARYAFEPSHIAILHSQLSALRQTSDVKDETEIRDNEDHEA